MRSYSHRERDRKLMLISKEIRESRTSRNLERYDWNMFLSRLLTINSWCEISDSTLNAGNDIHLISPKHHNWMIRSSGRGQTEIEFVWIYWIGKWHRFFFIMHEIHEYATHMSKKKTLRVSTNQKYFQRRRNSDDIKRTFHSATVKKWSVSWLRRMEMSWHDFLVIHLLKDNRIDVLGVLKKKDMSNNCPILLDVVPCLNRRSLSTAHFIFWSWIIDPNPFVYGVEYISKIVEITSMNFKSKVVE